MNYSKFIIFTLLFIYGSAVNAEELPKINIGAIFFEDELDLQRTFEATIDSINSRYDINFQLVPVTRRVLINDGSIALQREACDLIGNGVAAIFGPSSKAQSDIVALLCNNTGIPHIQFDASNEETHEEKLNHQMTLNVYPAQLILSKAYADIVMNYGWRKFTIVYDADDVHASKRLQDLLQVRDVHNDVVRVRTFQRGDDYRVMWKSIMGERRIVLDCDPEMLLELIVASMEFDLMGEFNNLFLTNLESNSFNWRELFDNEPDFQINVTAVRLKLNDNIYNVSPPEQFPGQTLLQDLIFDALNVFASALQTVASWQLNVPTMACDFSEYVSSGMWDMGQLIYSRMKEVSGVNSTLFRSSNLQFDEDGERVNFNIELFEPNLSLAIASWDTKGQLTPMNVETVTFKKKLVYRVATRIGKPYFMENETAVAANITGNARYIGYAVDLIQKLSEECFFDYVFVPALDKQIGKYNKDTKQWNGIIGELMNNDAHMGICDLTITQARKTVVDFTVPFMQLGISILAYKKPYEPKQVFAFLTPFAASVWIYVLVAIFIMSFLLIILARFAKDDWENPHPCNKDPEMLENRWHLANTYYLTMASIMTAGCDILPRSAQVRFLTSMWWIFAIIIANSYTANLAAFLTQSQMDTSISDIKDLAEQTTTKFGTIKDGSTYTFFSESNETTYRLAFNMMNNQDPSAYTTTNEEGVERVLKNKEKYMFLMETTTLDYQVNQDCKLMAVGEKFSEKHYAIAVPLDAHYRSNLSVGLLKLSEHGELFKIKERWWKAPEDKEECPEVIDSEMEAKMTLDEVRGIFYTLFVGISIAYIFGVVEFCLHVQEVAVEEKLTFKQAFVYEIKFVLCIWNNKKPISCTPTASIKSSSEKTVKSAKKLASASPSEEMRIIKRIKKGHSGELMLINDAKL